jgi:hypothetical protein
MTSRGLGCAFGLSGLGFRVSGLELHYADFREQETHACRGRGRGGEGEGERERGGRREGDGTYYNMQAIKQMPRDRLS